MSLPAEVGMVAGQKKDGETEGLQKWETERWTLDCIDNEVEQGRRKYVWKVWWKRSDQIMVGEQMEKSPLASRLIFSQTKCFFDCNFLQCGWQWCVQRKGRKVLSQSERMREWGEIFLLSPRGAFSFYLLSSICCSASPPLVLCFSMSPCANKLLNS